MLVTTFALLLAGTAGSSLSLGADTGAAILQDPPTAIRLDRNGEYDPGHDAQVSVDTEVDGFLLVIHADPEGLWQFGATREGCPEQRISVTHHRQKEEYQSGQLDVHYRLQSAQQKACLRAERKP